MKKQTNQKKKRSEVIVFVFFLLIGVVCGAVMASVMDRMLSTGASAGQTAAVIAALFIVMYVLIFLHIVIHEAGHLVFGLLTGYSFCSFRIGSVMLVRVGGRMQVKRLTLAGTGGQCLMVPPETDDGKVPCALYNLGGSIFNLVAAALSLLGYFLCAQVKYLPALLLMSAVIGFAYALMNGVPLKLGTVNNDGHNALSLRRDSAAMRAFVVQMRVNAEQTRGVRLKDMPEQWFELPSDEDMKNSITATIAVFACNRLMDEHRFDEADALMARLLSAQTGVIGLYRALMICDRIYCALLRGEDEQTVGALLTAEQKKLMKSMRTMLTVIRTEYVCALLMEKDSAKAAKLRQQFDKAQKTYPYPADYQSELELIELAEEKAS